MRSNWDEVYRNQKIALKTLQEIDEIFLAGGTAVQCYLLSKKYRESEDLDFFVESEMSSKESAKLALMIIKALGQNEQLHSIRHKHTEDGTHRRVHFPTYRQNKIGICIKLEHLYNYEF